MAWDEARQAPGVAEMDGIRRESVELSDSFKRY